MSGIDLIVDLDRDIDKIGGIFVGDEMRLRQVASNLVSNSIKFTSSGSVRIVTKLLYPRFDPTPGVEIADPLSRGSGGEDAQSGETLTPDRGDEGDLEKGSVHAEQVRGAKDRDSVIRKQEEEETRRRKAVVRVEVHDTGVGLRKQDIIEYDSLPSPRIS
jgi:signal transduction histidine kinase